jgi:glycosyltransferase involved in cell wall biosynthesis
MKLSIIVCAYNTSKELLRASFESIKSSTISKYDGEYEICFVDDGSEIDYSDLISEYKVKAIKTENRGIFSARMTGIEMAKGEYIAFCECDDYYTDNYKLQKQVNYMDSHPECSLCVHAVTTVDSYGNPTPKLVRHNVGTRDYTAGEVISLGENNFPTNSMMIRKKNDGHYPEFYYNCPVGDYPMQVYMSFLGTVHYIDEFMSCYRINADSSWTNRIQSSDEKTLNMYSKMIASLEGMDSFSEGRYHNEISDRINTYKLLSALIKHDIKGVYSSWGKVQVKKLPRSVQLGMIIPTVYYLLRRRRTKKRQKKYKNK